MALGRQQERQSDMMASWAELPRSPGPAFYDRLQAELIAAGFDGFVEGVCAPLYAARRGRPSLPPGRYAHMRLVGYFEGINSERGLEWRCSDNLPLREFLRLGECEPVPDHSWLSRTRPRHGRDSSAPPLKLTMVEAREVDGPGDGQPLLWRRADHARRCDAAGAMETVRLYRLRWRIENRAHYVRDMTLSEDASRIRTSPGTMVRIRSVALNVLHASGVQDIGLALYANAVSLNHLLALSTVWPELNGPAVVTSHQVS